jgi:3-hydroxyacyl-[acyl-carrier-protein] dehydratase
MRFIYFDRMLELEPGKRALAIKAVSLTEEFFPSHYGKSAVMPASVLIECMAQVAGWLHVVSRNFEVETMLVLVEDVTCVQLVRPGDTLSLEAWQTFGHHDGATIRTEARIGNQVVGRIGRMVFGSKASVEKSSVEDRRAAYQYRGGVINRTQLT